MTQQKISDWLENLKIAWETKDPQKVKNLCAENVLYYETPFSKPLNRDEVLKEWQSVPKSQKDIRVTYDILSFENNKGIAHWSAAFTRIPSDEKVYLDGIFLITLNEENLCTEFHQWWNAE